MFSVIPIYPHSILAIIIIETKSIRKLFFKICSGGNLRCRHSLLQICQVDAFLFFCFSLNRTSLCSPKLFYDVIKSTEIIWTQWKGKVRHSNEIPRGTKWLKHVEDRSNREKMDHQRDIDRRQKEGTQRNWCWHGRSLDEESGRW